MKTPDCITRLQAAGITETDARTLRRAAMTLHGWYEGECGNSNAHASYAIERDETTGIPYRAWYPHHGESHRQRIPDRERSAHQTIAKVLTRYPGLSVYYQTDPRGAPVYILRPGDVPAGADPSTCYHHGIAVYK